ncbi:MAG TPA: hypothetical protein VNB06_00495 [Thermoanaerobaculia bacterium]|nr:hypothetical protein [Thermoanaerobaculia bacterium]
MILTRAPLRHASILVLLSISPWSALAPAAAAEVRNERTLERTFAPAGEAIHRLQVDNVFGSIRVRTHASPTVVMQARERLVAADETWAERARAEVELVATEENGVVDLFVDGPFRGPCDCEGDRSRWRRHQRVRYTVAYDFELLVPGNLELELATVNDGDIRVEGVRGELDLRNVNGGITVEGALGGGRVVTVNGDVSVRFAPGPTRAASFQTVNGDIEVLYATAPDADVYLKTMWGDLRSEFPFVNLAVTPEVERRDDGRFLIRSEQWSAVRLGTGGPRLSFETLNGDVVLARSSG